MSRSVSTHRHAVETVYISPDLDDELGWQDFMYSLRTVLQHKFKTLTQCDRWQDREDHIILENQRGEVSVSEYCGLVAVCLAPLDPDSSLDINWCAQSEKTFRESLFKAFEGQCLVSHGFFSNGEQIFSPVGKTIKESCVTSKEGTLW